MEFNNENGVAVKNEAAKPVTNPNALLGAAKKEAATNPKPQNGSPKSDTEKAKPKVLPQPQSTSVQTQPAKVKLTLEERLSFVNDLHRRSVQRVNLISRLRQLEAFEIALMQENDELEDNPYQGCKLIIRDDKNRDFITTTPGLIRMVAQYIFSECHKKLVEIESTINFPNA